jgi:MFS family permease
MSTALSSAASVSQQLLNLVDGAPTRPIHSWLWLVSTGGTLLDGFAIFALGVALPLVVNDFDVGPRAVGLIGAALVMGAMIGAGLGGWAADRWGRRALLLADMATIVAGAVVSALAPNAAALFVGQLVVGAGIGIDFPVGSSYVSEVVPKRVRPHMMVATVACQSVGMLMAAGTVLAVLRFFGGAQTWRVFLAVEGAIAAVYLCGRWFAPQSPHWLVSHGRIAEAAATIARWLPEQAANVQSLAARPSAAALGTPQPQDTAHESRLATLFSRAYLRRTLLVSVPWFLMDVATYGVGLFTPVILAAIHLTGGKPGTVAAEFVDAQGSGGIDLFLLMGFLAGLWAVPRFGRLRMQTIGFAGMAVGMLVLLLATQLRGGASQHLILVFGGFIVFNLLMNAGPNATTFTLAPVLFPTQLRASAGGFAAGFAKLGATLGVVVLPIVKNAFGVPAVVAMMALISILGLVATLLLAKSIEMDESS